MPVRLLRRSRRSWPSTKNRSSDSLRTASLGKGDDMTVRRMKRRRLGESGQILPLIAAFMLLCGIAALAIGRVGGRLVLRARAESAADASALAGAIDGEASARRVAAE